MIGDPSWLLFPPMLCYLPPHTIPGVRRLLLSLASTMEPWAAKLTAASDWPGCMPPCDWSQLEKALANWTKLTEGDLEQVSRTQPWSESHHIRYQSGTGRRKFPNLKMPLQ